MKVLLMCFCATLILGCATAREKRQLNDQLAHENKVQDGKSLGQSVHDVIVSSQSLDPKQKSQLTDLLSRIRLKQKELLENSFRLRSLMIKEILAQKVNPRKVKLLKKEIKKNEEQRLSSTFSAIDEISRIVEKDPDTATFLQHMMYYEPIR